MALPIEDYALIGDCKTAALVAAAPRGRVWDGASQMRDRRRGSSVRGSAVEALSTTAARCGAVRAANKLASVAPTP